jgi:alkyl sulfatase BDS1-like metallo-beta-lactamase superfamily hydrolase
MTTKYSRISPLLAGVLAICAAWPSMAEESIYMGAPVKLASAENGAIVNQAVLDNASLVKHQDEKPYKLTEGVWVLPGPVLNSAVIEGPDGLIVWETGENMVQGKQYKEKIRKISNKPIKAVIYSHAHYTLGTRAVIEGEKDVMVIGHPNLNKNMQQASALGSYFPETEPLQYARAYQHAQVYLPEQGPDAKAGFIVHVGESGFVPVNKPVRHGEELTVAGVRMKFFTEGGSDTDDCISVFLPDRKLVLNNVVWPWMPNFYTPRGAKFRDPRDWITAVTDIRAVQPEYLISQHGRAIAGKEEVQRTINNYLDFIHLVFDQTLRGILQGKGPEELRDFIKLPKHLAQDPWLFQSYGQLDWYAPYIMEHAIGWWDGDAATLIKLPPQAIAERLVPLIGGRDKLLVAVREAQAKGELAWAMELLNYQFRLTPGDAEVKQLKADLLRRSAQVSTSGLTRAFMLSQALGLEGKAKVARVVSPRIEKILANPANFVNQHRVRIDPIKAQDTDAMMRFDFTDGSKKSVALHARHGVAEFVEHPDSYGRKADYVLNLDGKSYAALFLNQKTLDELVKQGAVKLSGDKAGASAFLDLFDSLKP